jgi:hypothetical protein
MAALGEEFQERAANFVTAWQECPC